jgi:acetylornithine deacetylase/succinyl-diaminopimelate desuccinylase-like protein
MMEIGYYPGCALHGTSNDYEASVRACLAALEVRLREVDDWICCGATAAHSFNHELSLALPARNLALAQRSGLEVILDRAPVDTDPHAAVVQAALRAARAVQGAEPAVHGLTYFTEGSVIGPATGLPMVILGPGEPGQAHQTDEHVSVQRLLECVDVYERLALEYYAGSA